jgi:hypothetical protein
MPRYMVERTFPDGLGITPDVDGPRRPPSPSSTAWSDLRGGQK